MSETCVPPGMLPDDSLDVMNIFIASWRRPHSLLE